MLRKSARVYPLFKYSSNFECWKSQTCKNTVKTVNLSVESLTAAGGGAKMLPSKPRAIAPALVRTLISPVKARPRANIVEGSLLGKEG